MRHPVKDTVSWKFSMCQRVHSAVSSKSQLYERSWAYEKAGVAARTMAAMMRNRVFMLCGFNRL